MNPSIIFFGNSVYSLHVLVTLLAKHATPSLIVTSPDKPAGRHLVLSPNPVKSYAQKNHLPIAESMTSLTEHLATLSDSHNQPVGLVAAYGRIIKPPILEKFSGQFYNLHPSLLPLYRGPSPLQFQILDRVTNTGITLIQMDEQVDHGPIVAQAKDTIHPTDTPITLGQRLFTRGTELFLDFLSNPTQFAITDQDHTKATFTRMLTRQDGFLPYEQFISQANSDHPDIHFKFKAFYPWPGVWTQTPQNKRLKIVSISPNITVQIEGGKPMPLPQLHL